MDATKGIANERVTSLEGIGVKKNAERKKFLAIGAFNRGLGATRNVLPNRSAQDRGAQERKRNDESSHGCAKDTLLDFVVSWKQE